MSRTKTFSFKKSYAILDKSLMIISASVAPCSSPDVAPGYRKDISSIGAFS